ATQGCGDRDGDGVLDDEDACPAVPGTAERKGCPAEVVVIREEKREIQIYEEVRFQTRQAVIQPESFGLLDKVAGVLKAHPFVLKVQVEGHTDSQGDAERNRKLSQARAEAVVQRLVDAGVAPARLVARGFGDSAPLADNATVEGRAHNRRVAFKILELERERGTDMARPAPLPGELAPARPAGQTGQAPPTGDRGGAMAAPEESRKAQPPTPGVKGQPKDKRGDREAGRPPGPGR
ncbi:MAG: OmpA family protein, partial [Deltaproteobacteria bacterium]|nr:OmpA family protein [Deltaproteobacteria bacterium]